MRLNCALHNNDLSKYYLYLHLITFAWFLSEQFQSLTGRGRKETIGILPAV